MRAATVAIKFVVSNVMGVVRILLGGNKGAPDRELAPHALWMRAAAACSVENLVSKRIAVLAPPRIEGVFAPLGVAVWPRGAPGSASATLVVRGVEAGLELRHESLGKRFVGGTEITIGDPAFDSQFFVQGSPLFVRAAFDAATRALALDVFGPRPSAARELLEEDRAVGVAEGELVARFVDDGYPHPPITPEECLAKALRLGERLLAVRLEERIAEVAKTDPLADVRRAAIATLLEAHPRAVLTRETLEAACADDDPRVRLIAAVGLGVTAGKRTLLGLASRTNVPDEVSARAVKELRSHLPEGQARDVLGAALRERRLETAAACLDTLSRSGPNGDVIARVLSLEAGALALAAARALGRCGTVAHIALLREVEARAPKDTQLRKAARDAVAVIRGRLIGADEGQVSLAGDDAGQVSLTRDDGGRMSLAEDDTRSVPLPGGAATGKPSP